MSTTGTESTQPKTRNIEEMDESFLKKIFDVPSTSEIAKFLKKNPSQFFPNPEMGDVAVYFADLINDLRFYHLKVIGSVDKESSGNTAADQIIARPSIFLSGFSTYVNKVISSLSVKDE